MRTWVQDEAAAYTRQPAQLGDGKAEQEVEIDVESTLVIIRAKVMLRTEDARALENAIRKQLSSGVIVANNQCEIIVIDKHGNVTVV